MQGALSVKDKIRAWRDDRAANERRALTKITEPLCETLARDLRRYVGWNATAATTEDLDALLKLAFTVEDLAETCRVLARVAESEIKRAAKLAAGGRTS